MFRFFLSLLSRQLQGWLVFSWLDDWGVKPGSDESFSQALRQAYWDLHDDPRYGLVV
jgi:hypothetical protein